MKLYINGEDALYLYWSVEGEWVLLWFSFKIQLLTHCISISLLLLKCVNERVTPDDLLSWCQHSNTALFHMQNPVKVITECTVNKKNGGQLSSSIFIWITKKNLLKMTYHLINNSHEVSEYSLALPGFKVIWPEHHLYL